MFYRIRLCKYTQNVLMQQSKCLNVTSNAALQYWLALFYSTTLYFFAFLIFLHVMVSVLLLFCRDSFPYDQQFNILMRFIVDQTQTPNLKVGGCSFLVLPSGYNSAYALIMFSLS